jgi:hypothetical protein
VVMSNAISRNIEYLKITVLNGIPESTVSDGALGMLRPEERVQVGAGVKSFGVCPERVAYSAATASPAARP